MRGTMIEEKPLLQLMSTRVPSALRGGKNKHYSEIFKLIHNFFKRDSPSRPRTQKMGRDWGDHPEHKDKEWDRRGKGAGSSSHRDWDDQNQTRQRPSGKGGHRRGPSPNNASPKAIREIE